MSTIPVIRLYPGSDSYLESQSPNLQAHFVDNKAALVAKNPALADPYAANWAAAIAAAVIQIPGRMISENLEAITLTVDEKMTLCRAKYIDVIYYAELAFGKKSPKLDLFGKGKPYKEASKSSIKMYDFMDKLSPPKK
jgi:hypothetical protein